MENVGFILVVVEFLVEIDVASVTFGDSTNMAKRVDLVETFPVAFLVLVATGIGSTTYTESVCTVAVVVIRGGLCDW